MRLAGRTILAGMTVHHGTRLTKLGSNQNGAGTLSAAAMKIGTSHRRTMADGKGTIESTVEMAITKLHRQLLIHPMARLMATGTSGMRPTTTSTTSSSSSTA